MKGESKMIWQQPCPFSRSYPAICSGMVRKTVFGNKRDPSPCVNNKVISFSRQFEKENDTVQQCENISNRPRKRILYYTWSAPKFIWIECIALRLATVVKFFSTKRGCLLSAYNGKTTLWSLIRIEITKIPMWQAQQKH